MSVEENKQLAVWWNEEIVCGGDPDRFDEALADGYHNWSAGIDREGMKERFRAPASEHPTWKVKVDDVIGEADKVAVRFTWSENGKNTGEGIAFYRIVNGKIVDDWYCSRKLEKS